MRAVLFSGQGSQVVGMGKELYEQNETAKRFYDSLSPEFDLKKLSFDGPAEELSLTKYAQPSIVAFHLAVLAVLEEKGFTFDVTAGLSLGQYSALVAAKVIRAEEALALIQKRANYMSDACQEAETTMWAVLHKDMPAVEKAVEQLQAENFRVEIANRNCPGQIVLSLDTAAVERVEQALAELKARVVPLVVEGGFHSSFMASAAKRLSADLQLVDFASPKTTLYLDTTGLPWDGEDFTDVLTHQVDHPTNMQAVLENMMAAGVTEIVEIGNTQTFAGFMKRINRKIPVVELNNVASLQGYFSE